MRATKDIALGLEAWATSVVPELSSYEHAPTSLAKALPMVVAEVQTDRVTNTNDPGFKTGGYQQVLLRVWDASLLLLVQPGRSAEETWTASQNLYGYVDALSAALRSDPTLGGRVEGASPVYEASYDPPEVQYADGTTARVATFRMTVGEQTGGV